MTIRYSHADQVGVPHELTDPDGHVQWRSMYKPWGAPQNVNGITSDPTWHPAIESAHQPLRFQGQYGDAQTGLHYNQHRYYDPDMGRFMTQDPIGLTGGINLYRYAPNPGKWIDPLGLTGVDVNLTPFSMFSYTADYPMQFLVTAHGSPSGRVFGPGNVEYTPQALARQIRSTPTYGNGKPIYLVVCHAGAGGRDSYGQRLANELREPVWATDSTVGGLKTGQSIVLGEGGQWHLFVPE